MEKNGKIVRWGACGRKCRVAAKNEEEKNWGEKWGSPQNHIGGKN